MTRYPSDRLHEEVAYLSYHFHWPYEQVMQLDHGERQRWVGEVARINIRLKEEREAPPMTSTGVPLGLRWLPATVDSWAPGMRPVSPFLTFNFAVEVEGLLIGGFSEVDGLQSDVQVEEYREGGVNGFVHKLPGPTSHANLVLRHGLTGISTLWDWYDSVARGLISRRNGTIVLLDSRHAPVMWWSFRRALPVRWTGPSLNAAGDEVGVESIELAHEGLSKPLLGQAALR